MLFFFSLQGFTSCTVSSGFNSFVWKAWNGFSLDEINVSMNLKANLVFTARKTVFNLLLQVSRLVKRKITDIWDASPPGSQDTDSSVQMGNRKQKFFLRVSEMPIMTFATVLSIFLWGGSLALSVRVKCVTASLISYMCLSWTTKPGLV